MFAKPRHYCASCRTEIALDTKKPGRRDECPKCGEELHSCLNCQHYDPRLARPCRETQAEEVRDVRRANFCGWFDFRHGLPDDGGRVDSQTAAQKFDSLFGGKTSAADPAKDQAAQAFDKLFKR